MSVYIASKILIFNIKIIISAAGESGINSWSVWNKLNLSREVDPLGIRNIQTEFENTNKQKSVAEKQQGDLC